MTKRRLFKSAFDCRHVRKVTAWALVHPDRPIDNQGAGRIVANFSDNANGGVCTCTIGIWAGPLKSEYSWTGTAGGCGYHKFSAAFSDALDRAGIENKNIDGCGESRMEEFLKARGYTVIKVI